MIICNSHRFIFFHSPKAAGTTISYVLDAYCGVNDFRLGQYDLQVAHDLDNYARIRWSLHKHSRLRHVKSLLPAHIWTGYFKFAFVRNPYARALSGFKFHQKRNWGNGTIANMNFSSFLRTNLFRENALLGLEPQSEFLCPHQDLDFIGRVETLDADLDLACSIIEQCRVTNDAKPQLNKGGNKEIWMNLSADDKDILAKHYRVDFETFGYSIEDGSFVGLTDPELSSPIP